MTQHILRPRRGAATIRLVVQLSLLVLVGWPGAGYAVPAPSTGADCCIAARGAPALSKEAAKSIRSLEQRLVEHQNKLDAFRKNPDAFDNKGFLKNAPSQEVRDRIIQGRVNHLEQEIRNFQQQIERLRGGGGQ